MAIRILIIASALFSQVSHAFLWTSTSACRKAALEANARGEHHVAITMEGLGTGFNGFAAAYARRAMRSAGLDSPVMHYSHIQPIAAARCAAEWKAIHGDALRVTFVGHSLGGGAGALRAIRQMDQLGVDVQDLIVFDGRIGHEVVCGDYGPKFHRPPNVAFVTNFYQCGAGLPGRTFVEDGYVRNIRLSAGIGAHVLLPTTNLSHQVGADLFARRQYPSGFSMPTREIAAVERVAAAPSVPRAAPARRRTVLNYHPSKANKPAKCFRHGATIPCTYQQASEESYGSASR